MILPECAWNQAPVDLVLASNEVHIWHVSLEQPHSTVQQLSDTLSVDERVRAERYHFARDRQHFILARGLLRKILGSYMNVEPKLLEFCLGLYGKPALAYPSGSCVPYFNLSHSHGLALYAFTRDCEVGIDLEYIRPIEEAEQIAERYFSLQARNALRNLVPDELYKQFFIYWTRMEAYLKARGDGLAGLSDEHEITDAKKSSMKWSIQSYVPSSGYVATVAIQEQD